MSYLASIAMSKAIARSRGDRRAIAIVPARGGSVRLKDKNITDLAGRPLIAYALEAARASGVFDEIHVSTDSERIRATVTALGFPVAFLRDAALADDATPLVPVMRWVLERYLERGDRFDDVCRLLPTACLIEAEDLSAAHGIYERSGYRPLHAVARYPVPIEWAFERGESGDLRPVHPGMFAVRSQDLRPKYFDTGTFSFYPATALLTDEPAGDEGFTSYELPRTKAVDIDDAEDLEFARYLFLGRRASRD